MTLTYKIRESHRYNISMTGDDGKVHMIDTDIHYLGKLFTKVYQGFSPIVAVCGKQRTGKSMVAVWLCHVFMKMMGKEFDPRLYTFYDPLEAISRLENKDRLPLLVDEAGGILHRREYYEKIHQSLQKIVQTQSYKTLLYVFVSPFISDIDKSFVKHFDFILRVDERGHYKAFQIMKKYDALDDKQAVRRRFLDDVRITLKDLPAGVWKSYFDFSIEQKEMMRKKILKKQKYKDSKEAGIIDDPLRRVVA